jgi:hypothetical protein
MGYLYGGLIPAQTFWLICGVFYLADNVRLLRARRLILTEAADGRWRPVFRVHNYRLLGRTLNILNSLMPSAAAIQMAWLEDDAFRPRDLRRTARLLQVYQGRLMPFRVLSDALFIVFFIGGPLVTAHVDLGTALVLVIPVDVTALVILAGLLVAGRRAWRMSWMQIAGMICECAACPGFFVNICRRMSLGFAKAPGDGLAYVIARHGRRERPRIAYALESCLDDLTENDEFQPQDAAAVAAYRNRLGEPRDHG